MGNFQKTLKTIVVIGLIIFIPTFTYFYFTDLRYPIPENSQIIIRLSRGAAMAGPNYEITLYEDGIVSYEGKRNVEAIGRRKYKISADKVRELSQTIEQKGYFDLDEQYALEGIYDAGAVITYVRMGQKEKEIRRQDVFLDVPELVNIENLIDEATASQRWVECRQPFWLLCNFNPYVLAPNLMFFMMAEWVTWSFVQKRKTITGIGLGYGIILLYGMIVWSGNWSTATSFQGLNLAILELVALLPLGLLFSWWHNRRIKIDVTARGKELFGPFLQ